MTAQPDLPVVLGSTASPDVPTRMLTSARTLLLHGLAVLAAAVLLGVAQALEMWMGTLVVAAALLLLAALVALAALVGRLGVRHRR